MSTIKTNTMRKLLFLGLSAIIGLGSCTKDADENAKAGYLQVFASLNTSTTLKAATLNPNDFKLTINKKSDGSEVKAFAKVSEATSPIELTPDTYIVKTSSNNFTVASWDNPLYEATQEVVIDPAVTKAATLTNTQANAGVKMMYAPEFTAKYADFSTVIESASGNLTYAKGETRTGYFAPGTITIKITAGGVTYPAKAITVNAKELVNMNVKLSDGGNGKLNLTVTIDNSVTVRNEDFIINPPVITPPTVVGLASLEETFQTGTASAAISVNGWSSVKVKGDKDWIIIASGGNNLAQLNSAITPAPATATEYESWLITPALDIDKATVKALTFFSSISKLGANSNVEVYLMDKPDPATATVKELLPANIAGSGANTTTGAWVYANVDLSAKTGVKYIGFKYVGTSLVATDFRMDKVRFGLAEIKNNKGITTVANTILAEDFASVTASDVVNGNGPVIAANAIANFPTVDAVKPVYAAGGALKFGTSSKAGSLTSKPLDLSVNGGTIKVSFRVKGWSAAGSINVTVGTQTLTANYTAIQFDEFEDVTLTFTGCAANSTVKFETPTTALRAFVDDIHIFY